MNSNICKPCGDRVIMESQCIKIIFPKNDQKTTSKLVKKALTPISQRSHTICPKCTNLLNCVFTILKFEQMNGPKTNNVSVFVFRIGS